MYYLCTYFDKNYLDKGLALYHSLKRHCQPFTLWILCLDDDVYRSLIALNLPGVTLISMAEFEWEDDGLATAKQNRSLVEYYFTCTSSLLIKILQKNPTIDILTYLDADLYFYSSIDPVYKELRKDSVLICEHWFPDTMKHLEKYGKYNVGLVAFRNDKNGLTCLTWWRTKCLDWCYDRLEDEKFADQKYLDDWPERFLGVIVLKNQGYNYAPWNLRNYSSTTYPVNIYHFHGLRRTRPGIWDTGLSEYGIRRSSITDGIYLPYIQELERYNGNTYLPIRKKPKLKNYIKKLLFGDYISVNQ
jgi:hypothetical protein